MHFSVRKVQADEAFIDFRHRWLRSGKPLATAKFSEDKHLDTHHFAAFDKTKIIGIISFFLKNDPGFTSNRCYQLRGMAVDKSYRSKGIGASLLEYSLDYLNSQSIDMIWCNVREESIGFYKKNGFRKKGGLFDIPDIGPHILMYKNL